MMAMEKSDFNRFNCLPNNYDCVFECTMNNNRGGLRWTPSKTGDSKYLVWAFKVWINWGKNTVALEGKANKD